MSLIINLRKRISTISETESTSIVRKSTFEGKESTFKMKESTVERGYQPTRMDINLQKQISTHTDGNQSSEADINH
ncbi:hypothetical protein [Virgibacillus siamensis]|uniref:hypothetical protein n=1 Tax=Virgibacillus siamensis TaxID=480071 RepID=UPI000984D34A|nr:hypothetical protein [Virgibacillus siamensis]